MTSEEDQDGSSEDYLYEGSNVRIVGSNGAILANTEATYSESLYVQFCCEETYSADLGKYDCQTHSEPIVISCCNCALSEFNIIQRTVSAEYSIDGQVPNFTFQNFTTDFSFCQIINHQVLFTSNSSDVTNYGWQVQQNTGDGNVYVQVPAYLSMTIQNYSLTIRVTADGNHIQENFDTTFYVNCTGSNNQLTASSTYNSIGLSSTQYVSIGSTTNFFQLPQIQNSIPVCASDAQISIMTSDSNQQHSQLNNAVQVDDNWIVTPIDQNYNDISYSFKIMFPNNVNEQSTSSTVYILHVGCSVEAAPLIELTLHNQSYELIVGESQINPFAILDYIQFTDGHPFIGCQISTQFNSIDILEFTHKEGQIELQPIILQAPPYRCSLNECGRLKISSINFLFQLKFQIVYDIIGQSSGNIVKQITSPIHTVYTKCGNRYQMFAPLKNETTYLNQRTKGIKVFQFVPFYCQYTDCCTFDISTYFVEYLFNQNQQIEPVRCCNTTYDLNGKLYITFEVDTSISGEFIFKIGAFSTLGQKTWTDLMEFIIVQVNINKFQPNFDLIEPKKVTLSIGSEIIECPLFNKNETNDYVCDFEGQFDQNYHSFNIIRGLDQRYMSFNEDTGAITLHHEKMDKIDDQIKIILISYINQTGEENLASLVIHIKNHQQANQQFIDSKSTLITFTEKRQYISAKIDCIDFMGEMTIIFNETMNIQGLNTSWINETMFDIFVMPANNRQKADDFNASSLNLTWKVNQFFENQLKIQIDFIDPTAISPNLDQDKLHVVFNNTSYGDLLQSENGQKKLHENFWTLSIRVPKQMKNNEFNIQFGKNSKILNNFIIVLLVFSVTLFLTSQGSYPIKFMFIMTRSMQMIIHLPLFKAVFPANVILILKLTVPTLGFDILDQFDIWNTLSFIKFNDISHEQIKDMIINQMVDISYDSLNYLQLLQTLAFILIWQLIKISFLSLIFIVSLISQNEHIKIYLNIKQKQLFFSPLFELFIQGYFEFLISSLFVQMVQDYSLFVEKLSLVLSCFSLVVILVLLPFALIFIIAVQKQKLQQEYFLQRWGVLYSNLNHRRNNEDRLARAYYLIYVMKRIVYVLLGLFGNQTLISQFIIIDMAQQFALIYQGLVWPSENRITNYLDFFNEFMVLLSVNNIIIFTSWGPDLKTQFMMGWFWLAIFQFALFCNLIFIMYHIVRDIKLISIKYYRIVLNKLQIQQQHNVIPDIKSQSIKKSLSSLEVSQVSDVQSSSNVINQSSKEQYFSNQTSQIQNITNQSLPIQNFTNQSSPIYNVTNQLTPEIKYENIMAKDYNNLESFGSYLNDGLQFYKITKIDGEPVRERSYIFQINVNRLPHMHQINRNKLRQIEEYLAIRKLKQEMNPIQLNIQRNNQNDNDDIPNRIFDNDAKNKQSHDIQMKPKRFNLQFKAQSTQQQQAISLETINEETQENVFR